jgi:hypothetical protein
MGDHDNPWVRGGLGAETLLSLFLPPSSSSKEMADILDQYSSLSPSSDPQGIKAVLGKIISGDQYNIRPLSSSHPHAHLQLVQKSSTMESGYPSSSFC